MSILYLLSFVGMLIQICFVTMSIAAGLYYLAELVEEFTVAAKKTITIFIAFTTFVYILLIFFEELPWSMIFCGLLAQALHAMIMKTFPFVRFMSIPFIGAVILLFVNHWMAFKYFSEHYYNFSEVLAFFTICLWVVPFALFVSLSANDNVLPTVNERCTANEDDIVTNYFSSRKKVGLLSLFSYAKESVIPGRSKKSF